MEGQTPTAGMDPEISARLYLQVMQLTNLVKAPPYNDPDFFGPVLQTTIELMDRMSRTRKHRLALEHAKGKEEKTASLTAFANAAKSCLDAVVRLLVPCAGLTWKAVESYAESGAAIIKRLASPEILEAIPFNRLKMLTDHIESERVKWIQPFIQHGVTASDVELTETRLFDFCREFTAFSLYLKAPVFILLREQTEKEAAKTWSIPESRFVKWRFEQM